MINRTKIKGSMYDILDKDPNDIQEYIDTEAKKTPKQKEKETKKRNQKSNIVNVNLQNNIDNQEDNPYNRIVIHTKKDNIVHNYFHHFELFWDAGDPLSGAILKLPKTNEDNTRYWITYTGDVVIYLGNEINAEMQKSQDGKNQETYLDLQGMKSIFQGEIGRIKEYNKELEIHIDSIGKRFKQKIPEDFRQSYINNQNVRDAFQAICEFLGVKYICPPPQATDEVQTDGTEKSVDSENQKQAELGANAVQQVEDQNKTNENNNSTTPQQQAQNLLDSGKSGITLSGIQLTGTSQNGENNESNSADQNNSTDLNANTQSDIQNGYADISFDANGNITHGSVGIESNPDMEDTLLNLNAHPLDKYLEDTTFVATDVKRFLDGEIFETVHNSVMNYGAITIQPKSTSSSDISAIGESSTSTTLDTNSTNNSESSNGSSNPSGANSSSSSNKSSSNGVKGVWGKTAAGSLYLTNDAINKMTMWEARRRYEDGQKRNLYTRATMYKLGLRMYGFSV